MDRLKNDLHMYLTFCAQNETEQNEELPSPLNSIAMSKLRRQNKRENERSKKIEV